MPAGSGARARFLLYAQISSSRTRVLTHLAGNLARFLHAQAGMILARAICVPAQAGMILARGLAYMSVSAHSHIAARQLG
jgi:hypothetical protein